MSNPYARAAYNTPHVPPYQLVTGVSGASYVPPNTTTTTMGVPNAARQPSGVRSDGYTGEDYASEIKGTDCRFW